MKNKKIIIISAIGIITLGIGLGFILLNSRINPVPIKPILENSDGYWYKNEIYLQNETDLQQNETYNFLKTLHWTLPFGDKTIMLSRMGSGEIENSFWQKTPIKTNDKNITLETLFAQNNGSDFIYDTNKNIYYYLNPGGYDQITLITEAEYEQKSKTQTTQSEFNKDSGTAVINTIEPYKLNYTGGPTQWLAIKRSTYHIFEGKDIKNKNNWLSDGYKIDCYIPVEGEPYYIEYSTQMTSASSEINNCDILSNMGIQSATIIKFSPDNAVDSVRKQQEVMDYIKRVTNALIEIDHENENSFIVHVFEINDNNMTTTFNWYEVNKQSGTIKKMFDTN